MSKNKEMSEGEKKAMEYFIQLQDWIEKIPEGDFMKHLYAQEKPLFESKDLIAKSALLGFLKDYLKKKGVIL